MHASREMPVHSITKNHFRRPSPNRKYVKVGFSLYVTFIHKIPSPYRKLYVYMYIPVSLTRMRRSVSLIVLPGTQWKTYKAIDMVTHKAKEAPMILDLYYVTHSEEFGGIIGSLWRCVCIQTVHMLSIPIHIRIVCVHMIEWIVVEHTVCIWGISDYIYIFTGIAFTPWLLDKAACLARSQSGCCCYTCRCKQYSLGTLASPMWRRPLKHYLGGGVL